MEVITKEVEVPENLKRVAEGKKAPVNSRAGKTKSVNSSDKKVRVTRDRPIKSILKAITWRLIASATTFGLAYLFFYEDPYAAQKATGIAVAESFIKMLLYFFHERAWERLRWGRMMVVIRRGTRRSKRSLQRMIFWKKRA